MPEKSPNTLLTIILNELIPPDSNRGLPGAGDLINDTYLTNNRCLELNTFIMKLTDELSGKNFYKGEGKRKLIVNSLNALGRSNKKDYQTIVFYVLEFYYSNEKVLTQIGNQSVPPFPMGNSIKETDLTIFGDVYIRGEIYRD